MRLRSSVFASCCLLFQVFGVALFLRGFFPVPIKSASGRSSLSDLPAEPLTGTSANVSGAPQPRPPQLFRRVVVMLVDALREDFLFGANGRKLMPYTRQLVERGASHSYVAKARAPTVTMPRIKALTTGSVPGFIDVVMNLNSPALQEDNLLFQAKQAGRPIIFYGDDTWLRLFPKHFLESDGTTSFFVSDYTEVDNNVTRHLDSVLRRDDWEVLVLHYLGLDHIGHLSGPHSSLVPPKLLEMDHVLKKIHQALLSKEDGGLPFLLVLCGDHGMSETGSHGGSSEAEVNTPLVLISPAFKKRGGMARPGSVEQVDLAPSLALALGLPVPQNSVGHLLPVVMETASLRDQLRLLHLNGHQLSCLLTHTQEGREPALEQFRVAERSHGNWVRLYLEGNTSEVLGNLGNKVMNTYLQALAAMSSALNRHLGNYDMYSVLVAMVITIQLLLLLLLAAPEALGRAAEVDLPASSLLSLPFFLLLLFLSSVHVSVCTSGPASSYLCSLSWGVAFGGVAFCSALLCILVSMATRRLALGAKPPGKSPSHGGGMAWSLSELDVLLLAGCLGHALSLGSSSLVEEEHQTWYFLSATLSLALFQEVCRRYFRERHCHGDQELLPSSKDLPSPPTDSSPPDDFPLADLGVTEGAGRWLALATPPLTMLCLRLLRSLNQTGVQWADRPDLGHWLNSSEHKGALSLLAALSLVVIYFLVQRGCSWVSRAALALGLLGVYSYRAAVGNLLFPWQHAERNVSKGLVEARFVYVFVLGMLFSGSRDLLRSEVTAAGRLRSRGLWELFSGLVLLVALLFRPHNLPLLACCLLVQTLQARLLWPCLRLGPAHTATISYWFGQAFFFYQGNSNSISTVDVSVGFVGLQGFMEGPALLLTTVNTYAGPLLWNTHLLCYLTSHTHRGSVAVSHSCYSLALLRCVAVCVYVVVATALRYHLFIWSVFSPKLLYEATHTVLSATVCLLYTAMDTHIYTHTHT